MVDHQYADPDLAELYDVFCSWDQRDDLAFYLPWVMSARAVLDVGCGTGLLLHRARAAGYQGRLCGLDPGAGMLARARSRSDVQWVLGDLGSVRWKREFDLVVMTGHAFQVFVDDEELRSALAAVRSALTDDGRFLFETRNPAARAWERWTPEHAVEGVDARGATVRMEYDAEPPVEPGTVRFTTTFSSPRWPGPRTSHSVLRFLDVATLSSFLTGAGLVVEERFGDWQGGAFTETSPEIITVARRG
ncbi:class I SAM-dependent DNA methyltransferase [Micromonospora sp. NPDC048868]|uniref:class I SAM-dependent DNA methyltransferase n=1 Tax=Micromonospora sp. NPDC048868 TaxID=3364258 RepID=UPI00371EDC95